MILRIQFAYVYMYTHSTHAHIYMYIHTPTLSPRSEAMGYPDAAPTRGGASIMGDLQKRPWSIYQRVILLGQRHMAPFDGPFGGFGS